MFVLLIHLKILIVDFNIDNYYYFRIINVIIVQLLFEMMNLVKFCDHEAKPNSPLSSYEIPRQVKIDIKTDQRQIEEEISNLSKSN